MNSNDFETHRFENAMTEWREVSVFVTAELKRLNNNVERFFALYNEQSNQIAELKTEIAVIKAKATVNGLISGTIATGVIQLALVLLNKFVLHGA